MHIVAGSDLHGLLPKVDKMPNGDVLCLCGDIVPLDYQNDYEASIAWFLLEFLPWTDSLPYKKVVFIAGNHDFFLEKLHLRYRQKVWDNSINLYVNEYDWRTPSEVLKKLLPGNHKGRHKLVYLCDNSVEIEGKVFYGTPWIKDLPRWAFYKSNDELIEHFNKIPKKPVDVLMTHMPPKVGSFGTSLQFNTKPDYGSEELVSVLINRPNIKYAICGHVHSGQHQPEKHNNTTFINVSIKDEDYRLRYPWTEFDI